MKSIKPGRGPSLMEGAVSLIVAAIGVVWTYFTVAMGAGFMAIFGVAFIVIALINALSGFYNASAKNRHSIVDIVDSEAEPDPFFAGNCEGHAPDALDDTDANAPARFCPYCGTQAGSDHRYCARCGKPLS